MKTAAFYEKWFQHAGMPEAEIAKAIQSTFERVERYVPVLRWIYKIGIFFFAYLAPTLLLGQCRVFSALDEKSLETLLKRAYNHRFIPVRALFILVQTPLINVLTEESAPPSVSHPLTPFLARTPSQERVFDVIVIGSGAGGAPLAWDLSRRGVRVALIEKGGMPSPESGAAAVERFYLSQGMTVSAKGGLALVIAGSTIGGTTSINSGTCLRPLPDALKRWDQKSGTQFSTGALTPWLDQVEAKIGVYQPPRELLSMSSRLFEKGMEALGREGHYVLPRNAPSCEGSGRCCFVCPSGAKQSTDRSFLPEAIASGMTFFPQTEVISIDESRDLVSIDVIASGAKRSLQARQLVIAAGGLLTPGLIRRNRLGSRLGEVGRHLKIHPAGKVLAHFKNMEDDKRGVPQGLAYRVPGFPHLTLEGIHVPKSVLGPTLTKTGKEMAWWLAESHRLASFGMFVRDRGSGRVDEWHGFPIIRYGIDPEDIRDLARGCFLVAETYFAAGADRVLLPIAGRQSEFMSWDEMKNLSPQNFTARDFIVSGFHPQGTAGIGRVVDTDLRLMGSRRISVCDASVFPDSPGVNPMVTIMALSLRLADHLMKSPLTA